MISAGWQTVKQWAVAMYCNIRRARLKITSLVFLYAVVSLSIFPVMLYIGVWAWVAIWGRGEPPILNLLQDLRLFVGTIFSTQVVAAFTAYGVALIDNNKDGQSDLWSENAKGVKHYDQSIYQSRTRTERSTRPGGSESDNGRPGM